MPAVIHVLQNCMYRGEGGRGEKEEELLGLSLVVDLDFSGQISFSTFLHV